MWGSRSDRFLVNGEPMTQTFRPNRLRSPIGAICGAILLAASATASDAETSTPLVLARDASFYVGGHYVKGAEGQVMDGAMYVHAMIPANVTHRYPIVMIHGINSTGVSYEGTPDGREGWAQFFVRAGYGVYVV